MLPSTRNVYPCRTKLTRRTKLFEEVRIGRVRLFFSHFELIAFQLDDWPPVVSTAPPDPAGHVSKDRAHLEPDKGKWLTADAFAEEWEKVAKEVFRRP